MEPNLPILLLLLFFKGTTEKLTYANIPERDDTFQFKFRFQGNLNSKIIFWYVEVHIFKIQKM